MKENILIAIIFAITLALTFLSSTISKAEPLRFPAPAIIDDNGFVVTKQNYVQQ